MKKDKEKIGKILLMNIFFNIIKTCVHSNIFMYIQGQDISLFHVYFRYDSLDHLQYSCNILTL